MKLPESARSLIESGVHAHLITLNPDGSPQVTMVWAGLDGDDIGPCRPIPSCRTRSAL